MKPIEIHIEGYKIVITEDKEEPKITINDHEAKPGDTIEYKPCQPYKVVPCCPNTTNPYSPQPTDWWRNPYVTWTSDDTLSNTNTTLTYETPVRDTMVGKATGGAVKGETHIVGEPYTVAIEIDKDKGTKCSHLTKGKQGEPGVIN